MPPHRVPLRARVRRLDPERRAGALAVVVALLGSGAMVWQTTGDALGASSTDPAASWSAGSVRLGDDTAGSALLGVSNLRPGSAGVRCIGVSATGDDPAAIRLYGTRATSTRGLASHVTLTITEGTGGGSGSCAGFTPEARDSVVYRGSVADFAARATGYASGLPVWSSAGAGSETRVFRVAYVLDRVTPDSVEGGSAALALTWEAQV